MGFISGIQRWLNIRIYILWIDIKKFNSTDSEIEFDKNLKSPLKNKIYFCVKDVY